MRQAWLQEAKLVKDVGRMLANLQCTSRVLVG